MRSGKLQGVTDRSKSAAEGTAGQRTARKPAGRQGLFGKSPDRTEEGHRKRNRRESEHKHMELSFAPMEGITDHVYRRLHAEYFPGADRYYAPFIAPDSSGRFRAGSLRDILPENNRDIRLVPQLLCSTAEPFLAVAEELRTMGYEEVNLNTGCPSGTVVAKHKGAGMLGDLTQLDRCLEEIFSRCPLRVSVKTRLGLHSNMEFSAILAVYRKYPMERLIIHARCRDGMYRSEPDWEAFAEAADCPFPVEYNGNIYTTGALRMLRERFPELKAVMIGRGAVCNPALFRRIKGGPALEKEELKQFHDALLRECTASGIAPHYAVSHMKELWFYQMSLFPGAAKAGKAILKSRSLPDYQSAVAALFSQAVMDPEAGFGG